MREVIFNDFTSGNHSGDLVNFETTDTQNNTTSLSQGGQGGLNREVAPLIPPLTPQTPYNALQGLRFTQSNLTQNHSMILQSENPQAPQDFKNESLETHKGEVFVSDFKSFQGGGEGSLLNINDRADTAESLKSTKETSPIPKQITLHSKYGNTKATFETTSASIMLPLTKGGEYFVFDDVRFFVIAGEGALYYLDCVKAYDFENLEAECLEQFLLTGKQPRDSKQRELIKDFLEIDTKNIKKGKMYLLPKGYEMIAQSLIQGN